MTSQGTTPVPGAARTLSSRLGVCVLAPDDLTALEGTFATEVNLANGPLACLFDVTTAAVHLNAYDTADRKLAKLLDYLNFDYWVYEPYRNLTQLVAHLTDVVGVLDPTNRQHRTLFYDCAWHYALAIATAVRTHIGGGELALREKANLARLLKQSGIPNVDNSVIHPPYVDLAVELITRFLVRPAEIAEVLRYAEYLAVSEPNRLDATVADAFGKQVRPIAARTRLAIDLTGGDATHLNRQAETATADTTINHGSPGTDQSRGSPAHHQMMLDEHSE